MSKNIIAMKTHKFNRYNFIFVPIERVVRGWFVLLISIYYAGKKQKSFAPSKVKLNIVSVEKSSFKRWWSKDWNKYR